MVGYSGANRPLWIIRNGRTEIEEIKATKWAIGGFTEESQKFQAHEVKLNKGDAFYIFSDGYADQFGGPDGKKLTTRKFRELLLSLVSKPMHEQESALRDFIESWQGSREQLDDILVIGVRV
jgi:serine phosphatase RsbU (regulator of sigma subunit)